MKVIGIVGWKNNGKTTLACKLIDHFKSLGLKVATIKHAHHSVDVDQPGKDTFRHREAGAGDVVLATAKRWVHIHEIADDEMEPPLDVLLNRLSQVDLVIVEGFKKFEHPKIEVHRQARGTPLLAEEDSTIVAVASDEPLTVPCRVLPLNNIDEIAAIAWKHAASHPRS